MYLLEWKEAKNTETLNEEEENKQKLNRQHYI